MKLKIDETIILIHNINSKTKGKTEIWSWERNGIGGSFESSHIKTQKSFRNKTCSWATMIPTLKLNYEMSNNKERKVNQAPFTSIEWNITSSCFLAYSFLISKTNSIAPGFTKSGGISATLLTEMAVTFLFWIA